MNQNLAVSVKNVIKRYDGIQVLDNFSMAVEKGTIYGLLGASGCGKTTLLGCIIGRKSIDSGEIQVFGKTPGSKGSGVPGSRIGYMPQDVALVPEYTVKECIIYFGRIANMNNSTVNRRFKELSRVFDLPPDNQLISECSGGQQRRVSLAAAIVHQPQLLILDEPTVGLDVILREKIWNYFLDLVRFQGISVIMTTHYIEECNNANKVGLMRNGKILGEGSPNQILAFYQVETLEQAFLDMCLEDDQGQLRSLRDGNQHAGTSTDTHSISRSVQTLNMENRSSEELVQKEAIEVKTFMGIRGRTLHALLDKNVKQFYRNIFGLILFCLLPLSQTVFFLYCLGGDIRDLKLAIINQELSLSDCQTYDRNLSVINNPETYECYFTNISCRFLEYLDNPMINKVYYDSLAIAKKGILHGEHVGVLFIPSNFTESYQERVKEIISIDQSTLEFGQLNVYLDMSNRETGGALKYKLIELFLDFQEDLYSDCMWNRRLGGMPIREEFLYGKKGDSFLIFLTPGLLISFAFFFSSTMTSHIIVSEKCEVRTIQRGPLKTKQRLCRSAEPSYIKTLGHVNNIFEGDIVRDEIHPKYIPSLGAVTATPRFLNGTIWQVIPHLKGVWERSLSAGVTTLEIILGHLMVQMMLSIFQSIAPISLCLFIYGMEYRGNVGAMFTTISLQGICGLTFGFWISVESKTHTHAHILINGILYPVLIVCGFMWPIECLPATLKIAAECLPVTLPISALRNILRKGWSLWNPKVIGYNSVSIAWTMFFIIISLLRIEKNA